MAQKTKPNNIGGGDSRLWSSETRSNRQSHSNKSVIAIPNDITSGLDSVSFETVFKDTSIEEIQDYRARCHLLHVSIRMYTVYFINILNIAKKLLKSKELLPRSATTNLKKDDKQPPCCVRVGIIGGGKLAQQITKCLLSFGGIIPEHLLISTRRPELLREFTKEGVNCMKDNTAACEFADVLLLCVLPAQLPQLAKDIKHFIRPNCIIYSIVAGTPISKLSFLLGTSNIITPSLAWNEGIKVSKCWNCTGNHFLLLKTNSIIDQILTQENLGDFIQIDERFPEYMTYIVLNFCITMSKLPLEDIVNLVEQIIFGESLKDSLSIKDFFPKEEHRSLIDLCRMSQEETSLLKKLQKSNELRKGFQMRFTEICFQLKKKEQKSEWDKIRETFKTNK